MKRLTVIALVLMLALGACVSNKTYKLQQNKVQNLEARQNSQDAMFEMARKDVIENRRRIDELIIRLNSVDSQLLGMPQLQSRIDDLNKTLTGIEQDLGSLGKDYQTKVEEFDQQLQEMVPMQVQLDFATDEVIALQDDLYALRAEYESILLGMDSKLVPLQSQLTDSQNEITSVRQDIVSLRDNLEQARVMNENLDLRLQELATDTNETLDALTDHIQNLNESKVAWGELGEVVDESSSLARTLDDIASEIQNIHAELAQQNYEIQAESESTGAQLGEIRGKLAALDTELIMIKSEISAMGEEVGSEMNTLGSRVDIINDELRTLSTDLEQVIAKERAAAEKRRAEAMNKRYKAALNEYYARNYENSILLFEEFLRDHADSALNPNAHYWIAENYYASGLFNKALREFESVTAKFPGTPKALDAQLKAGITYYRMDDKQAALETLQDLKAKNPAYYEMKTVEKYLKLLQK